MAVIIDGKKIAHDIRHEVKEESLRLKEGTGITPGLAVILVGDDPASKIYLKHKENACKNAGFFSREFRLPQETPENELLATIQELNQDESIHGILVQLPLPRHLNSTTIIQAIDPQKDVDGFHPYNLGRLFTGNPYHMACTPMGILELMDRHAITMEGKEAVIVGRSNIVGKPLALMLLNRHATVTICHTRTRNLSEVTKRAEILIAAAGKPEIIGADMVRNGAVVIDVGVNRMNDGRLVGDVAFSEVLEKASYITPVPGGVGPMTIAMLLVNTLKAASYKKTPSL
jgi:methylenetetrahydrofolate dehydrogenase (NADP+)/methenyltetrahydrofolate cyclohydrolase